MIKFHGDRNILFSELGEIFLNRENLETFLKEKYPQKEVVLTNYGRTAFQLILDRYNLKDCKIMIPAFICSVFREIFEKNNITPVLIDIEKDTWNISPKTLKKSYDKQAKALIVNNMNGLPCEVEKIKKILGKNQLLIEDCAHSLGAIHNNQRVGTVGDAAFFSFYKSLPSISGGFALMKTPVSLSKQDNSPSIISFLYYLGKNANFIKNFKRDKGLYEQDLVYEEVKIRKINSLSRKITSYYLNKIDKIISSKKRVAEVLKNTLRGKVEFQPDSNQEHVYTYFSFLLPKNLASQRLRFLELLRKNGVVGRVIWNKPLAIHYSNYEKKYPNTKDISERIVGIPINFHYSIKDAKRLAKITFNCLNKLETA